MESRNPQNVIWVTLWENYGKIGKVLVNLFSMSALPVSVRKPRSLRPFPAIGVWESGVE